MKTSVRRSVAALATACALLLATASPAAAVIHSATITGGTLTISKMGQVDRAIPMSGGANCTATLSLDITSDSTGDVILTSILRRALVTIGGNTYLVRIMRANFGNTAGTYNHTTGAMNSSTAGLLIDVYLVNDVPTCTESTPICHMATIVHLSSLNFTTHSTSSNVTLTGASTVSTAFFPNCGAGPFPPYLGGSVSIANMSIHMT